MKMTREHINMSALKQAVRSSSVIYSIETDTTLNLRKADLLVFERFPQEINENP